LAVGEVAIGAANCNVEDEVVLLVERCVVWLSLPWVILVGPATFGEEVSGLHVDIKDDVVIGVNVGVESVCIPVHSIDVEVIGE